MCTTSESSTPHPFSYSALQLLPANANASINPQSLYHELSHLRMHRAPVLYLHASCSTFRKKPCNCVRYLGRSFVVMKIFALLSSLYFRILLHLFGGWERTLQWPNKSLNFFRSLLFSRRYSILKQKRKIVKNRLANRLWFFFSKSAPPHLS